MYVCRLKNYYWSLAVFCAKLPNGQPLSKVVGPLGRPSEKYVNRQNNREICYEWKVHHVIFHGQPNVPYMANQTSKCLAVWPVVQRMDGGVLHVTLSSEKPIALCNAEA